MDREPFREGGDDSFFSDLEREMAETSETADNTPHPLDDDHLQAETDDQATIDAAEVAERVANVRGRFDLLNPDPATGAAPQTLFNIEGEATANRAVVAVSHGNTLEPGQPGAPRTFSADIGHYDPADQTWHFYPEYIEPYEVPILEDHYTELSTHSQAQHDEATESFINLRHPLTVQARAETAAILQQSGVAEQVIARRNDGRTAATRIVDSATSYRLALMANPFGETTAASTPPDMYGDILQVHYEGVLVDDGLTLVRDDPCITIARRDPDDRATWVPNTDLISPDEWNALAHTPELLLGYKQFAADFSVEDCAMVHQPRR